MIEEKLREDALALAKAVLHWSEKVNLYEYDPEFVAMAEEFLDKYYVTYK